MTARYRGPIVDVDIHHRPRADADLFNYLPKKWQDYAKGDGRTLQPLTSVMTNGETLTRGGSADTWADDGSRPGSSYPQLKAQILDRHNYVRAILTHQLGEYGTHFNRYYAHALCRAANDWNIDTWLTLDERLNSVIVIPSGEPEEAAKEVRRVGGHARLVGVLLAGNALGVPFGDQIYHPIYAAAADLGLPISIHLTVADRPSANTGSTAGPKGWIEMASQVAQQAMHYTSSFIVNGVFEKYPDLRVVIKEYGVSWLPSAMWKLDDSYQLLKHESSWVKKWPSEYMHRHIKVSTQPIEESPDDSKGLTRLLQTVEGIEEMLCFSTDYPHSSMDEPDFLARQFPTRWLPKIFCENACSTYGWTPPAQTAVREAALTRAGG